VYAAVIVKGKIDCSDIYLLQPRLRWWSVQVRKAAVTSTIPESARN